MASCRTAIQFNVYSNTVTFIIVSPRILPLCGTWSDCSPCSLAGVKCDVHPEASAEYYYWEGIPSLGARPSKQAARPLISSSMFGGAWDETVYIYFEAAHTR
jgi:hypothetical protein